MRTGFALLILPGFFFCSGVLAQYPAGQEKAFLVKRMIELNHYSPRPVDDSFSASLFKSMINAADPRRLLFTANEFRILSAFSLKLDDELKGTGWGFLDLFTSLYKKSLMRADSIINVALQKPFDFSVNESVVASREDTWNFAATVNELYIRWARYFKFVLLNDIYDIISDDNANRTFSKETIATYEPGMRDK